MVRCKECKSTIVLPGVSQSELDSGKPIPIFAKLADRISVPETMSKKADIGCQLPVQEMLPTSTEPAGDGNSEQTRRPDGPESARFDNRLENESADFVQSIGNSKMGNSEELPFEPMDLKIGNPASPNGHAKAPFNLELESRPALDLSPISVQSKREVDPVADHKALSRFYGLLLALIGLLTAIPAAYFLLGYETGAGETAPRWIYLLLFCGALQLIYSLFLIQVTDWSALWAISFLSLVVSCMFGAAAAALLVDDGFGPVCQLLQLAFSQRKTAMLACMLGLCTSVLVSYLCGREAWMWQRLAHRVRMPLDSLS